MFVATSDALKEDLRLKREISITISQIQQCFYIPIRQTIALSDFVASPQAVLVRYSLATRRMDQIVVIPRSAGANLWRLTVLIVGLHGCDAARVDIIPQVQNKSAVAADVVKPSTIRAAMARGITFSIDTTEPYPQYRAALTTIAGRMEFAAGRGRLDITNLRQSPPVAVNGITVATPLARIGDYYLFDSTGFILVRPMARTFSAFQFTRYSVRYGNGLIPGEEMIRPMVSVVDTLRATDRLRMRQHRAFTLRTHVERWHEQGMDSPVGRAWLDVRDAPAGESSVVRFFAAAQILTALPGGFSKIPQDSVQVTALLIVGALINGRAPLVITTAHRFTALRSIDVSLGRLTLPADFTETPWPGFQRLKGVPIGSSDALMKWQTPPN